MCEYSSISIGFFSYVLAYRYVSEEHIVICGAMLKPAMCLYLCKVVLLGVGALAVQAVRKVVIALPPV